MIDLEIEELQLFPEFQETKEQLFVPGPGPDSSVRPRTRAVQPSTTVEEPPVSRAFFRTLQSKVESVQDMDEMSDEFVEFAMNFGYRTPEDVSRLVNRILLSAAPATKNRTAMTRLVQYARMMKKSSAAR